MTKNGLDIQTISNKRTEKQADRDLLLGQVTIEKANPSHFLKFLLASRTNGTFGFAKVGLVCRAKPNVPFFSQRTTNISSFLLYNWLLLMLMNRQLKAI